MKVLSRVVLVLAMLGGVGSTALAAPAPGSQAVIAFINLLERPIVASAEAQRGGQPEAVARSLLAQLVDTGILAPDIADGMLQAIESRILPRDVFVLYLADLFSGDVPLATRSVVEAERFLKASYCNLHIPAGRVSDQHPTRILGVQEVATVVNSFLNNLGCLAAELRAGYWTEVE